MTLQQFFEWVQTHPMSVLYYFLGVMLGTLVLNALSEGQGHTAPWRWLYSVIVYAVCIPGIFAIMLNIYFFLFEKHSLMQAELLLQFVPVVAMLTTIFFIRKNVSLDAIPGFERIYSLAAIIATVLMLMWVVDRTHLYAISFIPFYFVIILLVGSVLFIRLMLKKWM